MTLPRDAGSIVDLVKRVAGDLTENELRSKDISPKQMRRWSNPDQRGGLPLEDAAALDELLRAKGLRPVFIAWFAQRMGAFDRSVGAGDLKAAGLSLGAETGDVERAIANASADGAITPAEARTIAKEADESAQAALCIRDAANALAHGRSKLLRVAK